MGTHEAVTGLERAERWLDQYLGSPETQDNLDQAREELGQQFAIAEGEASQRMKEAVARRVLGFCDNIAADAEKQVAEGNESPTAPDGTTPLSMLYGAARAVARIVLDTPLEVSSQRRATQSFAIVEEEGEKELVDLDQERIMRKIQQGEPIAGIQITFFEAEQKGLVHALGFNAPAGVPSPHDWLVSQMEQVLHGLRMAGPPEVK